MPRIRPPSPPFSRQVMVMALVMHFDKYDHGHNTDLVQDFCHKFKVEPEDLHTFMQSVFPTTATETLH